MDNEERTEARIIKYLFEDISEDNNISELDESDYDEEDHVSASDHDTNTSVDDSNADPDFVLNESELSEESDEGLVDNVDMVQNETVVSMAGDGVVLDTVSDTIEAVVGGLGGQEGAVSTRNRNTLLSKDKLVRWSKTCEPRNIRTRSVNLVRTLPGPTGIAKHAKTPQECFEIFINDEIVNIITENTNIYINTISGNFQRERACRLTDTVEMKAFFGLLILAGACRSGHQNVEELFSNKDGFGLEIFYGTMSLERFNFLLRTIRFDDIGTRTERRALDKFAAFREVFQIFVANCEKNYSLSCSTTIDEQLVPFRGKCPFRQYIKSKPAKYGIKILTLADAKMYYVKTMEVYLGAQPEGSQFIVSNKPYDVVLRLVKCIEGKGRNVTADNWFSSYPLVYKLLSKQTSYVGTIKKDKGELPREFTLKEREPKSSIFGFNDNVTIVSYAPKVNRSVVLISSMHHDNTIDHSSGNELKPEIVTYYNSTKSGVDVIDEKCATYSTSRRCRRWPLVLFYRLLDIAGINGQVIFTSNNIDVNQPRRLFLKEIGSAMVKPQAARRSSQMNIPKQIRQSAKKIGEVVQETANRTIVRGKKTRCVVCPRNKDNKTTNSCVKCYKPMCNKHMETICQECLEPQQDSE